MHARRLGLFAAIAAALCAMLGTAAAAAADTITVRNTNDDGPGSLRRAIERADSGDVIRVPRGRYGLTSGQLLIDKQLSISGAGARRTVLDANHASRVIEVASGLSRVVISKLTIREGDTGMDSDGGGIHTSSDLLLSQVALRSNVATPAENQAGGAVYAIGAIRVTLRQSLVARNRAYNSGGVEGQDVRAIDTTFAYNSAGTPQKNGDGGATDGVMTLIDSTVVGNRCFNGSGCGGGVFGPLVTTQGSLFAGNIAYESNGMPPGSPANPGAPDNCGGAAVTSLGHNLDSVGDCMLSMPSDISNVAARLRRPGGYGGPTDSFALEPSSPALNAGARECTRRDQRGVRRPQGRRCDIGAFELERRR
ncbi:MAG: hypothetical protein H0W09_02805 [Solirubrobacterales bacterium]|nr:hypothetical protein [Solirubrobacterales bacterium]